MKIKVLLLCILSCILYSSCDKVPINGALDGQWQLMERVENNDTTNLKDQHLYCAFQLKLCMFGSKSVGVRNYFCYFEHNGNQMRFHTFTHRSSYTEDDNIDILITDKEKEIIHPWGFYSTDCTFMVEELNNKRMTLSANGIKLTYRKL